MGRYERYLLNELIDSYERSLLFTGENKINVNIAFVFTKKSLPAYFEESSLDYEEIHACVQELEQKGFVSVRWKRGRENHILDRILLREEKLWEIYGYLRRIPKRRMEDQAREWLKQAEKKYGTPVCRELILYLRGRLEASRSVKEFLDITDLRKGEALLGAVSAIEQNEHPCYIREFSIRHFADSKALEEMAGSIARIMHRFGEGMKDAELSDILAEYNIYRTPNYVYFKGNIVLSVAGETLPLGGLRQGIGLSGEDIPKVSLQDWRGIRKVITIENLTTFFRWNEESCLILYLGGYHNRVRRSLLQMIYCRLPHAEYCHFGDIDAGGFGIYEDLCARTGIPFRPYRMDVDTLKKYEAFGRRLTENDRKRIQGMLDKGPTVYGEVLRYMLEHDVKLEQECVEENML